MGKDKKSGESMLALVSDTRYLIAHPKYAGETVDRKKVLENLGKIIEKVPEQERIEEIVNQLVIEGKAKFIQLIRDKAGVDSDTKEALEIIKKLENHREAMEKGTLSSLKLVVADLAALQGVLEKKIDLTQEIEKLVLMLEGILEKIRKKE